MESFERFQYKYQKKRKRKRKGIKKRRRGWKRGIAETVFEYISVAGCGVSGVGGV